MSHLKTLKIIASDIISVVDYLDEKNKDAGFSLGCIYTKIEQIIEEMQNEDNQNHGC